jgi:serine/threonine protein phosphatase 1
MAGRTFAIGDIHGDFAALEGLMANLPSVDAEDTLVFVGDYLDRGPNSAEVVAYLRDLPQRTPAKVVFLRGNHEDGWLRVVERGWPEFTIPQPNGCLATLRSFQGRPPPGEDEGFSREEFEPLMNGTFFPDDVVEWMRALPYYYEDDHAIYVHAALNKGPDGYEHPRDTQKKMALLWCRDKDFVRDYRGKLVIFGHTPTSYLPAELSDYTPDIKDDVWVGPCVIGIDTRCGKGGFLSCVELPSGQVYESK